MTELDLVTVAYAKGAHTFMGLDLIVGAGALVPRPETELLARGALAALERRRAEIGSTTLRVVDMCCGAGNLACALAVLSPGAEVWASDLSEECAALTKRNVEKHGLGARVHVYQGDLFAPLPEELAGTVDLVVCNPPYISSGRLAERDDLTREPRLAFDGGPYGLSVHQRVSRDALVFLEPGGYLAFEFGLGQDRQLKSVVDRARGYEGIELVNDDAGNPRVLVAKRRIQ